MRSHYLLHSTVALISVFLAANSALAQGTAFTYQGNLNNGGNPANGLYDFQCTLFDAATNGNTVGGPLTNTATAVTNGLFTMTLDFGAGVFTGPPRWLGIGVRSNGSGAGFTALSQRQALTPAPYAVTASNLSGTLPAAQLSGTLASGQLGGVYTAPVAFSNAANSFVGDGGGLSNLPAANLNGAVAIANGGTGNTTAAAALTALGGASLTGNNTYSGSNAFNNAASLSQIWSQNNGLTGLQVVFPNTTNQSIDQGFSLTGSAWTTGASLELDLLGTNDDSTLPHNPLGYSILNQCQVGTVPTGNTYGDNPGVLSIVTQGAPIVMVPNGTTPVLWANGGSSQSVVVFPNVGAAGTNQRAWSESLINIHTPPYTNIFSLPQDMPSTLVVDESHNAVDVGTNASLTLWPGSVIYSYPGGTIMGANGILQGGLYLTTNSVMLEGFTDTALYNGVVWNWNSLSGSYTNNLFPTAAIDVTGNPALAAFNTANGAHVSIALTNAANNFTGLPEYAFSTANDGLYSAGWNDFNDNTITGQICYTVGNPINPPGVLPVANGGTGQTNFGSAGQVMTSTGSATAWSNAPSGGSETTNFGAESAYTAVITNDTAITDNVTYLNLSNALSIANGGTGQTTAGAALAGLGGASVTGINNFSGTNNFYGTTRLAGAVLSEFGPGTTIYTDPTLNQSADASLLISSSPWTSGSFFTTQMKMTNQIGGPDLYGYYTWDNQAMSMGSVGWQAAEGNLPGVNLIVMNNEPLAIATSSGTGNLAQIWISHPPEANNVIFPLTGDGTKHRPISTTYGTKVFPADGQGSTLWINEDAGSVSMLDGAGGGLILANGVKLTTTNGVIVKANGTLNNSAAFDPADGSRVHFDSATVEATNFVAPTSSAGGPSFASRVAFDAAGNASGMTYELTPLWAGIPSLMFGTAGNPCFAMTGTNNSWFNQPCAAVGGAELEDGRTWGNSMFEVHGSTGTAVNTYTTNHTATVQDSTILVNGTALTITLPDATAHCTGRTYTIKLIASSPATVATTGAQNIDGSATYSLLAQYKYVTVRSDGTQWWVVGGN